MNIFFRSILISEKLTETEKHNRIQGKISTLRWVHIFTTCNFNSFSGGSEDSLCIVFSLPKKEKNYRVT